MKILLTGATGFIGQEILKILVEENHDIVILTRNEKSARKKLNFPFECYEWQPEKGTPPAEAFHDLDAVIHLAGEGIAEKRWTNEQKRKIRDSRILGTKNLVEGLKNHLSKPLKSFVSASAIGFYGESNRDNLSHEDLLPLEGFLPSVCHEWEQSALEVSSQARTVILRVGVVLGANGGALKKMLPLFKFGLGGPIGFGKRGFSWIHIRDMARLFVTALHNENMQGIYNGVAPEPCTNLAFTKALSKSLKRPAIFMAPPIALKIALGEMSEVVLKSQFISSKKAEDAGFKFLFRDIESAINEIIQSTRVNGISCYEFIGQQWVDKPVEEVFSFFSQAKNLEQITPPWLNFKVLKQSDPEIKRNLLIDYKLKVRGVPLKWQTLISDWQPPTKFVDEQLKGPYRVWHHTHEFKDYKNGTLMRDRVLYKPRFGIFGDLANFLFVAKDVRNIFSYRKKIIDQLFEKK